MTNTLNLMPGELVEVRSEAEILATLDEHGNVDGLPLMPEMLAYCGRRFRVHKRADKTCDTIEWTGLRRMTDAVHLALLRCNGEAHGGCQAGCLLYWKEVWLKRAAASENPLEPSPDDSRVQSGPITTLEQLDATTRRPGPTGSEKVCYRCQTTQLREASSRLSWWSPAQYWRDMHCNGVSVFDVVRGLSLSVFNTVMRALKWRPYPNVRGNLTRTPTQVLNLQPGELVEVKSKAEILATLDCDAKNRGMSFDAEMLPYCGRQFRVLRRVDHILNEKTGEMIRLPNPAIILNDVICTARYHRFCPRETYSYWREIWLRRAPDASAPQVSAGQPTGAAVDPIPVSAEQDLTASASK